MDKGGSVATSGRALRASDWYAEFHGTPYRAGPGSDSHKVNLYWRRADGSWGSAVDPPDGFELNPMPLDQWQEKQVMGEIPLAAAEFLREDVEDLPIRPRRRRAASA